MQLHLCMKLSTSTVLVFTLFLIFMHDATASTDKAEKIRVEVEEFVIRALIDGSDDDIHVEVKKLDPRIPLPDCEERYVFSTNNYDTRLSSVPVKVECRHLNWFTYVHVTIKRKQTVIVSSGALSPGAILSENNLTPADIDKSRLRGSTYAVPDMLIGARLKRRVREGTIITSNMLCFVCKGDRITVSANVGGLAVKTSGIALEDGVVGETIRVENTSSSRQINARVVTSTQVEVNI
ncbi:flagellar basal body P-ring formation chaperone FlgA [Agaribacter flavus]|uniref:Flagella basal body P-ring formation protein FlgA n=1 Tax=Agaribacter flavus TaxID=1902781 RepID=A0ABV7FNJ5_9ALTE